MTNQKLVTVLDAVIADTTSSAIEVGNAKKVTLEITENATVLNRSGVFTVTGSIDGSTYTAYNLLISNVTNTNSQNYTRVASVTRAAAGTDLLAVDMIFPFKYIKVSVDVTDAATPSGSFTVKALIQY